MMTDSEDPEASESLEVLVEIPRGSRNKYEYDHRTGRIRLDRVLYSSVHYPADYGFVPETLAGDGDPLDALVLVEEPTFPGCIVPARPIGVLDMSDEKGEDWKLITVPLGEPRFEHVQNLADVGPHWLLEIETFFKTYKMLQGDEPQVRGWRDAAAARRILRDCREAARSSHRAVDA
jgi:inorganic pyrophosphatase